MALACAKDTNCKAFRYSANKGYGYLCNNTDARYGHDDWVLCNMDPGELIIYS